MNVEVKFVGEEDEEKKARKGNLEDMGWNFHLWTLFFYE
ncbi:hypothetical protein DFR59_10564 [Falsibacillus pallidus]|uniref:Uncharacterized protein n=1 Tax=Falsibacillus pallidus TaxID=493781 RepID=A0A370GEJ5_9BACI|nr:hypothetical protein DFR59_10564 [Falsibacillus pallidus]